jgi:hypothetical protein
MCKGNEAISQLSLMHIRRKKEKEKAKRREMLRYVYGDIPNMEMSSHLINPHVCILYQGTHVHFVQNA